jgi:hypothetical protein
MQALEEHIQTVESANSDNSAATREYKIIESSPHFHDVKIVEDKIIFTTVPIHLNSPAGDSQTVNLGRLEIHIYKNGNYRVYRDITSDRDPDLPRSGIHPHVGAGNSICQGNANEMSQLATDRQLAMLATFIYEFLHHYNISSPYWKPYFAVPCVSCEHRNTDRCNFCICSRCGNRRGDKCIGCTQKGMTTANTAHRYLVSILENKRSEVDEDDYIDFAGRLAAYINNRMEEIDNV